jgi:hypothetical protein
MHCRRITTYSGTCSKVLSACPQLAYVRDGGKLGTDGRAGQDPEPRMASGYQTETVAGLAKSKRVEFGLVGDGVS